MNDTAPELPHGPDLPNAGYATRREKLLSDGIMYICREMERDRLALLSIVIDGHLKWRSVAKDKLAGLRLSDELCDAMYRWFEWCAGPNPMMQRDSLLRLSQVSPIQKVARDTELYRVLPVRNIRKR